MNSQFSISYKLRNFVFWGKLIWDNVLKSASVFLLHPYHGVIVIVIVFDKPKSKSLVQAQPQI